MIGLPIFLSFGLPRPIIYLPAHKSCLLPIFSFRAVSETKKQENIHEKRRTKRNKGGRPSQSSARAPPGSVYGAASQTPILLTGRPHDANKQYLNSQTVHPKYSGQPYFAQKKVRGESYFLIFWIIFQDLKEKLTSLNEKNLLNPQNVFSSCSDLGKMPKIAFKKF